MTQEDKELLLKDLCARFPYRVFISYDNGDEIETKEMGIASLHDFMFDNAEVKPYLRNMEDMTKEEYIYLKQLNEDGTHYEVIDFCNERHLDYRGLIPMGLAIEAPEGMYE